MNGPTMLRCWTTAIAALWLLCLYSPAHAARILKYDLQTRDTFVVTAYADQETILAFPSIVEVTLDQNEEEAELPIEPIMSRYSKEVRIVPKEDVKNGTTRFKVVTEGETVQILVRIVDRETSDAYDRVEFYDGHARRLAVQEACQRDLNTTIAHMYFKGGNEIEFFHEAADGTQSDAFRVDALRFQRLDNLHQFLFTLTNLGHSMLPIETIRMSDSERRSEHTTFVELDATSNDPELMAQIPPGKTIMVYLQVDNLDHLGSTPYLQIVPRGMPVQTRKIWPFGEPYKEPPPNQGRVSVQIQGVAGAVSLIDPLDNSSSPKFTTVKGFGARALYGFAKSASFEGSLDLLTTGDVDFDDMSVEATIVRFLLGATIHTGEKFVPYARAAIGGRLSTYTMSPAGDAQATELRLGGLYSVGGGIDAWRGDSFVIGLSANLVGNLGSDESYSFEAGLHAGYAWKPERKRPRPPEPRDTAPRASRR